MNYPSLPRSGLLAPRLLRVGLPVSVSELASDVDAALTRAKPSFAHQRSSISGDGSRLRRRFPFTGGSECPTPTGWTLSHNRRCALLVVLEHRRRRGEHRTTLFDRRGSNRGGERASNSCGRCIPSRVQTPFESGQFRRCPTSAVGRRDRPTSGTGRSSTRPPTASPDAPGLYLPSATLAPFRSMIAEKTLRSARRRWPRSVDDARSRELARSSAALPRGHSK